ncbi:MAG: SUMF1/EgtB/PvdO family nonheme iron enzyme [Succinimonas sp.]|nr:SUMF1/EgtB/PvdO family nonheme iron enzyme [Succinimonas sp.]
MKKGFLNGLNFIWQAMLVTGCGFVFMGSTAAYADEDDLVLKGPDNTVFEFRRVRVTGGKGPLDGQSFIMGDVAGDFRTPPTAIVIGGGFVDNESRYYYMGKYEVTVKQYKAVTGEKIEGAGDDYPVTGISWIEAQNFIDKLNTYLFEHELKALPVSGSYPGYVRLPTEEEWEFAARGGTKVESTVFDADTPYDEDDELSAYEWFSGPSSSHNKVQKVGKLKPNPLGLHDMLGNVQEMTSSLYRVEYYQGRSGGFTMRGGNYLTPEDDMVSSRRA